MSGHPKVHCVVDQIISYGAIFMFQQLFAASVTRNFGLDLEIGRPKMAIGKFWGTPFFKGDRNILTLQQ